MRIAALFVLGALLLTAAPLVAPTAAADGCDPRVPGTCVQKVPCIVSVHYDPKCIIYNPCDPRYCDPWLP